MPVYKLENYIERCIKSILNQTYKAIELILINDGSKDNSPLICSKYQEVDERVKYFTQENKGVSSARNLGLDNASGKYVMFIDGDDYVSPNIVEKLLMPFERKEGLVFSTCRGKIVYNFDYDFEEMEPYEEFSTGKEFIKRYLAEVPYMQGAYAKIYLREKIADLRFCEGKAYNEDGYFTYQYLQKNKECYTYKTEERLYAYYMRSNSATHSAFSPKRLSIVEFSDRVLQDCQEDEELIDYAIFNYRVDCLL